MRAFPLLLISLAACGSPQQPAKKPAPVASASAAPPPAEVGPTREERMKHKEKALYISCLAQVPEEKEFCTCIAGALTQNLTLEELESNNANPDRLKTAQALANKQCPATEPMVKANYLAACLADRKDMQTYCDCTWTEFRKVLSAEEMASDDIGKNEKFTSSRKPVVKACEKQLPEKTAQESFNKMCSRGNALNDKFCACAWKEARKLGSPAEIESGIVSLDQIADKTDVVCKSLRPKPPAEKKEEPKKP